MKAKRGEKYQINTLQQQYNYRPVSEVEML